MTEPHKIMAVSLESQRKYIALASYDGQRIFITHCKPINGPISKWRDDLMSQIESKSKNGFTVLVEDRTQFFVVGDASPFSFEEMYENRSMLFHALDHYFSMLEIGQIITEPETERFLVRSGGEGQKIERTQDDKGRTAYRVDWGRIDGGTKAVLMCVAGAMMQPLSMNYLATMYDVDAEKDNLDHDHKRAWQAITKGVDESRIREWDSYYDV